LFTDMVGYYVKEN